MAKQYKLRVEAAHNEDGRCGYYSKGHDHDEAAFRAAVCNHTGEPDGYYDDRPISRDWWRAVPDSTGEFTVRFHEARTASRGAFPVMVIEDE